MLQGEVEAGLATGALRGLNHFEGEHCRGYRLSQRFRCSQAESPETFAGLDSNMHAFEVQWGLRK